MQIEIIWITCLSDLKKSTEDLKEKVMVQGHLILSTKLYTMSSNYSHEIACIKDLVQFMTWQLQQDDFINAAIIFIAVPIFYNRQLAQSSIGTLNRSGPLPSLLNMNEISVTCGSCRLYGHWSCR